MFTLPRIDIKDKFKCPCGSKLRYIDIEDLRGKTIKIPWVIHLKFECENINDIYSDNYIGYSGHDKRGLFRSVIYDNTQYDDSISDMNDWNEICQFAEELCQRF